jgi:hypothetical protein
MAIVKNEPKEIPRPYRICYNFVISYLNISFYNNLLKGISLYFINIKPFFGKITPNVPAVYDGSAFANSLYYKELQNLGHMAWVTNRF